MHLSTPILTLPPELLHQIILSIDLPKDFLSLALSCRLFFRIIIPDILKYCKTRCRFNDDTWAAFAERPILCQYVKYLKIYARPWPKFFFLDQASYAQISPAIRNMKNLLSFRCTLSPSSVSTLARMIAEALNSSGCMLKELELNTYWPGLDDNIQEAVHSIYPLFSLNLSALAKISIETNRFSTIDAHCTWQMLSNCPSLTHLHLDVCPGLETPDLDFHIMTSKFLTSCHWPRLRHLTIKGFDIRENIDISVYNSYQRTFLNRHIHLETLYITSHLTFPVIPLRLQAVACYPSPSDSISHPGLFETLSAAPNLTHLFLFSYGSLAHFKGAGGFPSLKTCVLPPISFDRLSHQLPYLVQFTEAAPNVEQMAIRPAGRNRHEMISTVIRTLIPLKKLTVVLELFSYIKLSELSAIETLQCAYEHPTLSYVDIEVNEVIDGHTLRVNRCIRLLPRESGHHEPAFEVVPLSFLNPNDWRTKWGGFFSGFTRQW